MGERIRAFDWARTSLGPPEKWPQALKSALGIILHSRYQMFVWWGPKFIKFYNDAYRSALGNRHPGALGRRASEVWREIWETVGPDAEQVYSESKSTWHDNQLLVMERNGYPEETFFSYSYSPIPNDEGGSGGVFCACTETTERVIGERRLAALRQLASATASAKSIAQTCELAANVLHEYDRDVSFAFFYLIDEGRTHARLCAQTGIAGGSPIVPEIVNLQDPAGLRAQFWPFQEALTGRNSKLENLSRRERLPGGPWPEATNTAMLFPLKGSLEQPIGFVVLGASPRRPFEDNYEGYFELVAGNLNSAITNARAYEEERKRAEQLGELDRAKTLFFSNVSHELRTPLTLMLGPLEDSMTCRHGNLPKEVANNLAVAHRSGLRLLKLVNTLLDFARIEAGRIEANYEPTDLCGFTVELASVFRSAIEKAGLRLVIECPPLPEPVYVDREMWEKIVLNLLSNAFKFTFEGEIRVRLHWCGERVEMTVRDTGVGIPEGDLGKIFERFHRVRNAKSRTHEGTGIGLALVQELAHLHGGEVKVRSEEGKGTEFIVSIQTGKAHLPPEHIRSPRQPKTMNAGTTYYAEEALEWLPGGAKRIQAAEVVPGSKRAWKGRAAHVLVADDNADMREYVRRLLGQNFEVATVADGEAALESIGIRRPDLVLTDVMMPRLDGFGLLQRLRDNEQTRTIPIIMLSARAGEESRVEGLDAGADDYLVKPFTARELIARVQSQLDLASLRREGEERVKQILESITDGFVVVDVKGRFTELNAAARRMFASQGVEANAIIGRRVFEMFPKLRKTEPGRVLIEALEKREASDTEAFYEPWTRWYFIRCRPLPDGGAAIFFQDITARKRADIAMRESEERFRALVTASSDVLYRVNADWSEIRELQGQNFFEDTSSPNRRWLEKYIHPDDQPRVTAAIREATRNKGTFELEHRVIRAGGAVGWTLSRAIPMLDANGEITEWFGAASDISERKAAEEALRASEKHLELVSDSVPALIAYVDRNCRYRSCNRTYTDWFGLTRTEVTGRKMEDVLGGEAWEQLKPRVEEALRGKMVEFEIEAKYHRGGTRWVHVVYTPHQDREKGVQGIVVLVSDISQRKRAEQELKKAQEELRKHASNLEEMVAERTAKLRETVAELESFSYSIAHDMRAPLRSMRGYAEIVEQEQGEKLDDKARDYLRRIGASAERLDALIRDVLNYSKVVRGETKLQSVRTEKLVRDIIDSYADFQAPRATVLVQTPLPNVLANPAALTQVIANLLGNAVKFVAPNTQPEVVVRAECKGEVIRLWFEDNGIGIPPNGLERIFKMFQRLHPVGVYEGTGIGLAIIRKAVDRMGGTVGVESEVGKGSRFWVELQKA
jgi:PAS domain S-box